MSQVTSKETPADTIDLSVEVGPLRLRNPLMTASGTAGLGLELGPFYDLREAGAIVVKTLTHKLRRGNPMPRLCETPSGLLNSIGLPNRGLDDFLTRIMPRAPVRSHAMAGRSTRSTAPPVATRPARRRATSVCSGPGDHVEQESRAIRDTARLVPVPAGATLGAAPKPSRSARTLVQRR